MGTYDDQTRKLATLKRVHAEMNTTTRCGHRQAHEGTLYGRVLLDKHRVPVIIVGAVYGYWRVRARCMSHSEGPGASVGAKAVSGVIGHGSGISQHVRLSIASQP